MKNSISFPKNNHVKKLKIRYSISKIAPYSGWIATQIVLLLLSLFTLLFLTKFSVNRDAYCTSQIEIFLSINKWLSAFPEEFWLNITHFGDATILLPMLALFIFRFPTAALAVLYSIPIAALLSHGIKKITAVPRPAAFMEEGDFIIMGDILNGYNSFPSGHTIAAFTGVIAIAVIVLPSLNKNKLAFFILFLLSIGLACLVGISRIAIGVHWPLDILFGATFGWFSGACGAFFAHQSPRLRWIKHIKFIAVLSGIFLFWGVWLFFDSFLDTNKMVSFFVSGICAVYVGIKLLVYILNK
jgi:membrane-associated phospholipid phosphatase